MQKVGCTYCCKKFPGKELYHVQAHCWLTSKKIFHFQKQCVLPASHRNGLLPFKHISLVHSSWISNCHFKLPQQSHFLPVIHLDYSRLEMSLICLRKYSYNIMANGNWCRLQTWDAAYVLGGSISIATTAFPQQKKDKWSLYPHVDSDTGSGEPGTRTGM